MRWRYILLGAASLATAATLLFALRPTSAAESGAMTVDCNAGIGGVQTTCAHPVGTIFLVQVQVTKPPPGGYLGLQAKLAWQSDVTHYVPANDAKDEAAWRWCDIPARDAYDAYSRSATLLFGCIPLPLPTANFMTTGPVLQLLFRCARDGESRIGLVPRPGDEQLGTHFLARDLAPIDPVLASATVTCGSVAAPPGCPQVACPTVEPAWTPEPTPTRPPPPDVSVEADCAPDDMRLNQTAVLTCSATIVNAEPAIVRGAQLWVRVPGEPFDMTIDGQPRDVMRFQRAFPLPDLLPGEPVELNARFLARIDWYVLITSFYLVHPSGVGNYVTDFSWTTDDAAYPPTGLAIEETVLTEIEWPPSYTEIGAWLPPETIEYDVALTNQSSEPLTDLVALDHYGTGITVASSRPTAATIDPSTHTVRWDLGTLSPGEERHLRVSYRAEASCSWGYHDFVVTGQSGGADQAYAYSSNRYVPVGTEPSCGALVVHDDPRSGGGPLPGEPVDPTQTPVLPVQTPPDLDDAAGDAEVLPRTPSPAQPASETQASVREGQASSNGASAQQPITLPQTGGGRRGVAADAHAWALLVAAGASVAGLALLLHRRRASR
jgi:hypothetical protein